MGYWKSASRVEIEDLIESQLERCTEVQRQLFHSLRIKLTSVAIERAGRIESVFAVAKKGSRFLFFEDVEEGFEWSEPDEEGVLREYGFEQLELCHVLSRLEDSGAV